MKYSIERAEIRNHENERDRYYQVIDETIYRGPFAFNVRALSPCSLSMSTTSEEERLPWASLSRPNRFCRRSTYALSIANTWPKYNAFSSHLRVRLQAASDALVTTLCVYNARRRFYTSC